MSNITYFNYDFAYWELFHKVTFDGVNKEIIINEDELSLSVKEDIYSAWKEWSQLRENGKYEAALRTIGGDPIGDNRFAGDLYFLINGWQIVVPPQLVDIQGAIFNDEDIPVFDISPGGGVTSVVSQLVQTVGTTGGGDGSTLTQQQIRDAMTLAATQQAQAGSIDQKLDDIKSTSDSDSTSISNIESTVNSVESTVNSVDSTVTNIDTNVSNIDTTITGIDSAVTNIDSTTADTNDVLKTGVVPTINSIQTNTSNLHIKMDDLTDLVNTLLKYQSNRTRVDTTAQTLTVYDDDGVTPIRVFDLLDQNGDPSYECIFERVPQ